MSDNVVDFKSQEYTVSLKREDALDLIALLTQFECLVQCWFKTHEPASSRSAALAREIMEQVIKDGLSTTGQEFKDRVNSFFVSDLNIDG